MAIGLPATAHSGWWSGLAPSKRHLTSVTLIAVTIAACLPFAAAASRSLALPGGLPHQLAVLEPFRAFGAWLNQHLAFDWVPPGDRSTILFLLVLPTGALLVAVFRLVLGIRVLGLRAILLGLGIQAIGLQSSFLLLVVIVGSIALIRPWIRRARLPRYARITFVVGLSATIMVGAVFVATWLGSEAVWRVAFFPAIITAMFAESVVQTLEQDDLVMATWRGCWTIVVALAFALIDRPVSLLVYQFPELILTQLMAIVLVAELLDIRVLEAWPERLSQRVPRRPRVAVVCNRDTLPSHPVTSGFSEPSVQAHVHALRKQGFEVRVLEGDKTLLSKLSRYLPPDPRQGTPGGIVLNLATGVRGEGHGAHVPAMLEVLGVPYTGPGPVAHGRFADRFALLTLLRQAQVPVPLHFLVRKSKDVLVVEFPAWASPRFEPGADRWSVRNRRSLRSAIREIRRHYGQDTLVEEMTSGRKISVALIGNDPLECLPLVEHLRDASGKVCPAPLDETIADRIRSHACAAFRAAGCRDYARIDLRVPRSGEPVVIDVRWSNLFALQGAFLTAAKAAGYEFATVTRRIVAEAAQRYVTSPSQTGESTNGTSVVSLATPRAAAV
ncbi:MAG TPA: 7TM domain-containing protein [Gemmatimonadales bacterium]|nr:7TM domain-containing protein [Gemmatimonadales bacterium]